MDTSVLKPNDPRVKYETAVIRGKKYSYILGEPSGPKRDTFFLIHGFPDMAFGWRHQIPYLMSLGFQVVAPNKLGYADSDAPQDLSHYTMKSTADDLKELAEKFVGEGGQIVLGGHDWGGFVVWRFAMWHPKTIKAVFSVCTPMRPPQPEYRDLADLIAAGVLTNLKYQLQLRGPEVQERIQGRDKLRQMFTTLWSEGRKAFHPAHGFDFDKLAEVEGPPDFMTAEELEHYVDQYSLRKGEQGPELRGPMNWYRTWKMNFEEEAEMAQGKPLWFEMPALFVAASRDPAIPPSMSAGMESYFANLARDELDTSHWMMTEAPDKFNAIVGKWLSSQVYPGSPKLGKL